MWTSKGSEADTSTAAAAYVYARVGGMIGVEVEHSLEEELLERVPHDMPDGNLAAETCVLTHMTKATNHLDKYLSSFKKSSQPRRTGPLPTFYNDALADTSVDVILDLYPGDVVVILHLTEEAITEDVMCVLVKLPVAKVTRRPAERSEWLEVETIGQNGDRLKPILSTSLVSLFSMTAMPRSSNIKPLHGLMPTKVRSQALSKMSYTVRLYMPTVFNRISLPGSRDLLGGYTFFQ